MVKSKVANWVQWNWLALCLVLAGVFASAGRAQAQAAPAYVWLEGEKPTHANVDFKTEAFGNFLSGDGWLHINIDAGNVAKTLPPEGAVLDYDFTAPAAGNFAIWNRLGYDTIRPSFDWKIDDGAWTTQAPTDFVTDLTEVSFWTSVGWLHLGDANLTAGAHTLHIRLLPQEDKNNKPQGINYASDAIAIVQGQFRPNGKYKPDDTSWQTDDDKAAAANVFQLPAPTGAAQAPFSLAGRWQFARYDEGKIQNVDGPIDQAPPADSLYWSSMPVPSDRNVSRPDETFAHRYFLRTRVNVPAAAAGHSFFLHFPAVNLIATVFVNGQQCGWTRTPFAIWDCDITKAIKPGAVNEIWVGIKDTYYAMTKGGDNPRPSFSIPTSWQGQQFISSQLDFPVWNHFNNGVVEEPTLVVAGPAYTSDVFAIPSLKNHTLGLEVTVNNPGTTPEAVEIHNDVLPLAGGPVEKSFAPQTVTVAPGSSQVVKFSEAWASPHLWWPDDPFQYNVETKLVINGAPADERLTKFGFREWDWSGKNFKLNGVNWFGRADTASFGNTAQADIDGLKAHGENMIRFWGQGGFHELATPEAALDFFDAHGMPIRRTGIFDGEGANYSLIYDEKPNPKLFQHYHEQLQAWVKGQRNHPSIFIWSIENEITFINAWVSRHNPVTDPEMSKAGAEVAAIDPTRPYMTDGGNALLDESMPVYGCHYMEGKAAEYPEWGYTMPDLAHKQIWPVTQVKPVFFGETYYSNGWDLGTLAAVGGEAAMVGKAEAIPAIDLLGKEMSEGYRWSGMAAFHFWKGHDGDLYYNSWQPIAVLCRQWNWTFGSGQRVDRTLGIFNDTHYPQKLTLTRTLKAGGKIIEQLNSPYALDPGSNVKFPASFTLPTVAARTEGEWDLTLSSGGKTVFTDVKPLSVLPPVGAAPVGKRVAMNQQATLVNLVSADGRHGGQPHYGRTGAEADATGTITTQVNLEMSPNSGVLVYDPDGGVKTFLTGHGIKFTPVDSLKNLPDSGKVLVVGRDALGLAESTSSQLAAWASVGRTVVVLEQTNPLKFQGLPAAMDVADGAEGSTGFPENMDSPVFKDLAPGDFFAWGDGEVLYRGAYHKPTSGGRSLLQVDENLTDTALVEVPAGKGLLLLSQLAVGETLATNAVAQRLLVNMIHYGEDYKQTFRSVALVNNGEPLNKALDAIGLKYDNATDALTAISKPGGVAIIEATPNNLQQLVDNPDKVDAFTAAGGWIIFNNLTPDGLDSYNKLVGYEHMIRKFEREKVSFPTIRQPIIAGLSTSDIVMGNGQRIFGFQAGDYAADDAFSYVVDLDDVAPFAKSDFFAYRNIVHNYTIADGWPLIIDFPVNKDNSPFQIHITLPKPQTITAIDYTQNLAYWTTNHITLSDGTNTDSIDLAESPDRQHFDLATPLTGANLTLTLDKWTERPGIAANLGIDDIRLIAQRPAGFTDKVKPLMNIGAMVEYPRGAGGIVLCNVNYKDTEAVPDNLTKKRDIINVILRNLDATFSGGTAIIAGANYNYTPLDISKQVNAYRDNRGWFGDTNFTFADLPIGSQKLAGVPYNIYDFKTSPVPTVIVLGGQGVPGGLADHVTGIPVNQKATALFFLQAARVDRRKSPDDVKHGRHFELARYVVHYADGNVENIPVYSEEDVDNYRVKTPAQGLAGAQLAWSAPYAGSDQVSAAYSMQWTNPHPDTAITSIDVQYGNDRVGVPALLAVTAAVAQ